ncbi:hypothetical protein Lal_00003853 [Lupinus albus]|nr:hypothetical protein Lal_00003853 [Lupinus albus]
MAGATVTVTDADFEEKVLKSDKPVLVDFWAAWCDRPLPGGHRGRAPRQDRHRQAQHRREPGDGRQVRRDVHPDAQCLPGRRGGQDHRRRQAQGCHRARPGGLHRLRTPRVALIHEGAAHRGSPFVFHVEPLQRPKRGLLLDGAEQPVQRQLDILLPGDRRPQLQPQPGVARMRPYGLEAHGQQMIGGQHTRRFLPGGVPERLHRLEPPADQILGNGLHHHPAQPLPLVSRHQPRRHQLDGIGRDRTGREGRGARHIRRRRVQHKAHRDLIDIDHPAAGSPLQQHGGDPCLLLQLRPTGPYGCFAADRIELPEDTGAAALGDVREVVQRERYEPTPHEAIRCGSPIAWPCPPHAAPPHGSALPDRIVSVPRLHRYRPWANSGSRSDHVGTRPAPRCPSVRPEPHGQRLTRPRPPLRPRMRAAAPAPAPHRGPASRGSARDPLLRRTRRRSSPSSDRGRLSPASRTDRRDIRERGGHPRTRPRALGLGRAARARSHQRDDLLHRTHREPLGDDAMGQPVLLLRVVHGEQRPRMARGENPGRHPALDGRGELQQPQRIGDLRARAPDAVGQLVMRAVEVLQQLVVRRRLFQRVQLGPVEVLQQRVQEELLVIRGPDDRGDLLQPGLTTGPPAPLAHDELIALRRQLPYDDGLEETDLLDRGDQFGQRVLVEDLTGLPRVGGDEVQRQLGEVSPGHLLRHLLRGGGLGLLLPRRGLGFLPATLAAATPRSWVSTGTAVGEVVAPVVVTVPVPAPAEDAALSAPFGAGGIRAPSPRPSPLRRSLTESPPACCCAGRAG